MGRKEHEEIPFVGLYWDIVLDFILAIYGLYSFDIANEMTKICYLCKITEDIVHSGKGTMYYLKESREYTAEQIDSYCKKNGKVNLKDMIAVRSWKRV